MKIIIIKSCDSLPKFFFQSICLLMLVTAPAHAETDFNQRLSFAISGGASLGAYEAGVNTGLLTLMRYETQKGVDLSDGKFRPYEAASMTGAFAGSINTLLSGSIYCFMH